MPLGDYRTKNELWSELQSSKLAPAIPSVCDSLPDGPDHPEVAANLNDIGNAHGALGDPRTKKDFLERVLKIEERHFGADRPEVAATLNDIGNALGRLSHKERIMERAFNLQSSLQQFLLCAIVSPTGRTIQKSQQLSTTSAMPMEPWETLAQRRTFWSESWRLKSGTSVLTVQKSQQLSTTSAMPLGDYRTKNELWSELQSSKLAPAIPSVCDSLPDGPDHPEVAATLNDIGNAHGALGDPRTKKDFLERVLKIEERHFGADRPEVAATLNDIGNALGRLSHKERIMERASIFKAHSSNSFCVR